MDGLMAELRRLRDMEPALREADELRTARDRAEDLFRRARPHLVVAARALLAAGDAMGAAECLELVRS